MTDNLSFDLFILVLRIAFIFLLYFFIFMVVRTISRELNTAARRSRAEGPEQSYPAYGPGQVPAPETANSVGRLLVTDVGTATTVQPGVIFELAPVMPVGRKPGNAILLDDEFVSSEHALMALRDGHWWLSDVASTNGTYLNGLRIVSPTRVNWGDQVGIGGVKMRLEP